MGKFLSRSVRCLIILAVVLAFSATAALAAPYTQIVSFGDSLSDVGNIYLATGGSTPASAEGYYDGRFSNGEVWVEQLAGHLGMTPATASLAGGTNYAYGGFTTSLALSTATAYVNAVGENADSEALYTVWAGANDFFGVVESGDLSVLATIDASITSWAGNVSSIVSTLHDAGARNFLVLNLPPLGDIPAAAGYSAHVSSSIVNSKVESFNTQLFSNLDTLANNDSTYDITTIDAYSLFGEVAADPSAYGLENVTDMAMGDPNADASTYLFWDEVHPTTVGHSIVAGVAASAVPEPSTLTLLLIGAMTSICCARRYRRSI